ncbi:hypothetical protein ACLB1E_33095 [Escherichia coli]
MILLNGCSLVLLTVLIIVPETLQHQWLVEMLRRFNLRFALFDDERYAEAQHDAYNPLTPNSW